MVYMNKPRTINLLDGNIFKNLLKLVLPMLLANFFSVIYNIVDAIWIGRIVGTDGLAVSAITFPVALVLIAFGLGIGIAVNILSGQYVGANNDKILGYFANVAYTVVFFLSTILVSITFIFSKNILILLNTPDDILYQSVTYFKISAFRYPFLFYYMVISALLRSMGDTKSPLLFLGISSLVNIILDPLLMLGFWIIPAMGIYGAAVATAFSQFLSVVISIVYLKRKKNIIMENPFKLVFDFRIIKKILKIGLPYSTSQLVISISWMILISIINTFGNTFSAAVGAASKVEGICYMFLTSLVSAIATMSSQAIGADRLDKISSIFSAGLKLCILISLLVAVVAVVFADNIIGMFIKDALVIQEARYFIYFVMPSLVLLSVAYCCNAIANSAGKTKVVMLFSFISLLVVRPICAYMLSNNFGIFGVWGSMVIATIVNATISLSYYKSKKWMKNSKLI